MTSGVSLPVLLTIIFMILKLCGVISWSWLLVCLPVIIGTGLGLVALLIWVVVALVTYYVVRSSN